MAKDKNATQVLFVTGRSFEKKDGSRRLGLIELVVIENGEARTVQQWCDPATAEDANRRFGVLEQVELVFEQRMTGSGVRSELVGIEAAAVAG